MTSNTPGSDSAGPVAPMNGYSTKKYFFDVTTTYNDLLNLVNKDKIIMGIPYCGYVETLSYGRARQDEDFSGENCHFDDLAQEPWCGYTDQATGKDRLAWFENSQSIKIKYDFAKSQDLAGIAIWTLGYDKDYPDLWDILRQTFD